MGFPPAYPSRYQTLPDGERAPFWALNNDNTYINMLRNAAFLAWNGGTSARPDSWEFDANGGSIARESTASNRQWGKYSARVAKNPSDTDVSRLYQNVEGIGTNALMDELYYTFGIRVKCSVSDSVRAFYFDGTDYYYSDYHSGGGSFEELLLSFEHTSGATDFMVGIECKVPTSVAYYVYVDCAMLTRGIIPLSFEENPADRSVICQDYDNNGTQGRVCGIRAIPFKKTGTTTGGAVNEKLFTYSLNYGCRKIVHVSLNLHTLSSLQQRHNLWANNYTTTGFDVYLGRTDGRTIAAALSYTVDGVIWAIGWDDPSEQFKTV